MYLLIIYPLVPSDIRRVSSEETFEDLFRDDFLQAAGSVERRALRRLDNITPYCRSVLRRGLRARQEQGTGMGAGVDYAMEYAGVVGGMVMGLLADFNERIPAGHTFGGDGLRDFIGDHQNRLEEGEANVDALCGEMARMRTSLEHVVESNRILVEDNRAFFACINMLVGAQQTLYERVTALEGTRENPIEIPDDEEPVPVPPPVGAGRLVPIEEELTEEERAVLAGMDREGAAEYRSDLDSDLD